MKTLRFCLGAIVAFSLASLPLRADNPDCMEPNVLIMLDISDSMGRVNASPPSKYDQAIEAIHLVTQNSEAEIRFGLMLFPSSNEDVDQLLCSIATTLAVDPGLYAWNSIYRVLFPTLYNSTLPSPDYCGGPEENNWTPMYQALSHAHQLASMLDDSRRNYGLLITDGKQNCCGGGDYDDDPDCIWHDGWWEWNQPEVEENRQDLVDLVTTIHSSGIDVFVVGFGEYVDPLTLDLLAQAGGTAQEGCTQNGDCYYQADDADSLLGALNEISQLVRQEVCDGIDNDCDGLLDEDVDRMCQTACGTGFERCVDGALLPCDAPQPQPDICDGIDNDCDGILDPGCPCIHGEEKACGSDVGACQIGTRLCDQGSWGLCVGNIPPSDEVCDGLLDEDCDGYTDDGCTCVNGDQESCGTNIGICQTGTQTCNQGEWGPCVGAAEPNPGDPCDGLDNDCDGITDEYCSCIDGQERSCGTTVGICEIGLQTCTNGEWSECEGAILPQAEACDNQDNDCNGQIDNQATCPESTECRCGACVGPCDENDECLDGGLCVAGYCVKETCPPDTYCDGFLCVEGTPPGGNTDSPASPGIYTEDSGCSCRSTSSLPSLFLVGIMLALVSRRRRYSGHR